jgi:D-amino-acid oxidase
MRINMSKKVCVIGSGIIGLGSALYFLHNGHRVTIVSDPDHYMPTSPVSAAFWFPYACSLPVEQEIAFAEPTYHFLKQCMQSSDSGISIRKGRAYFDETVELTETTTPWWAKLDTNFRHLTSTEIPPALRDDQNVGPIVGGWSFEIPVIHIPTFLTWLQREAEALGAAIKQHRVASLEDIDNSYDWIVNCAGGWATQLTSDPVMVGYQGTVIELPGEPLGPELLFLEKGKSSTLPTYIVPQGSRTILGGTLKPITKLGEAWQTGSDGAKQQWVGTDEDVAGIIERCQIVSGKPIPLAPGSSWKSKTGLRPVRFHSPPRIELASNSQRKIVHNYGHGGSGVTFFWGSAQTAYHVTQQLG